MKKSSFVAMVLGTVSGVFFALGMCMALIAEWGAFRPGIVFGCVGLLLGIVTLIVWRKMERKAPIQFSGKTHPYGYRRGCRCFSFGRWNVFQHGLGKYDSGNCDWSDWYCRPALLDTLGKRYSGMSHDIFSVSGTGTISVELFRIKNGGRSIPRPFIIGFNQWE